MYFSTSPTLTPVIIQNAEHYVVDVLIKCSECTTFTDIRADTKLVQFIIHSHRPILKLSYNAYMTMHALEIHFNPETTEVLDPERIFL